MEHIAVYGIYRSRAAAENAVEQFRGAGLSGSDISVLFSSLDGGTELAHTNSTKAPEGVAAGTISGATVGGILGWLAGIGTLAIPGVGPLIAAGPIMATFAGIGVGGAVGGLTGALVGLGIPEYEAQRYEGRINSGGILVSVHAENERAADFVRDLMKRTGAEDISKKQEASSDNERAAHY